MTYKTVGQRMSERQSLLKALELQMTTSRNRLEKLQELEFSFNYLMNKTDLENRLLATGEINQKDPVFAKLALLDSYFYSYSAKQLKNKMLYRTMNTEEYNSILNKTHPTLKNILEISEKIDAKLDRAFKIKNPILRVFYTIFAEFGLNSSETYYFRQRYQNRAEEQE